MENPYCKYNAKNWMEDGEVSDEQLREMFPGISSEVCSNIQGKLATSGNYDQITYDNQIRSYITETGLPCWYYPYLFQEQKTEEFTGEHGAAGYARPFEIIMVVEIKDTPSWVSGLGLENDDNVTAWIHIKTFKEKVKNVLNNTEDERYSDYDSIYCKTPWEHNAHLKKMQPKPKDCFQVLTSACDREWDAGSRIWEITNVEDEVLSENFNPAQGHYIWKITAKRYRYSFEYGMSNLDKKSSDNPMLGEMGERGNHQVYENDIVKMYLAVNQLVSEDNAHELMTEDDNLLIDDVEVKEVRYDKKYSQDDVCEDAKKEVFDMEKNVQGFYEHLDSGGFF